MQKIKSLARTLLRTFGYELHRYSPPGSLPFGTDPFQDMAHFVQGGSPMIFDVGANAGQTVEAFKQTFPKASIHSFEPHSWAFGKLQETISRYENVKAWNVGIGSLKSVLHFNENYTSGMSSFLEADRLSWGYVRAKPEVQVMPLDLFAAEHGLEFIDILKCDTQGFEFEVFKGAQGLMKENKIGMIYFEYIFSEMYKEITPFHEVLKLLLENNFSLISFYNQVYQEDRLSWADVLFINNNYKQT